jgi:hypothetical protein
MIKIIGYTYDADYHCELCMLNYARNVPYHEWVWPPDADESKYTNPPGIWMLDLLVEDEIIRDIENNPIHPIFNTDEWLDEARHCADCGAQLDE